MSATTSKYTILNELIKSNQDTNIVVGKCFLCCLYM